MQIPSYGAAPISATFLAARTLQLIFLIVMIGLTANFVNGMVMANHNPSKEIVGALVIVRIFIAILKPETNIVTDLSRNPLHLGQHILLLGQRQHRSLCHGGSRFSHLHRFYGCLNLHRPPSCPSQLLLPLAKLRRRYPSGY
jgi:hypothetical protein